MEHEEAASAVGGHQELTPKRNVEEDGSVLETIRRRDRGGVAVLSIDSPGKSINVIDQGVLDDLRASYDDVMRDESVNAIVLTSAKRGTFGAGADIEWLPILAAQGDAEEFLERVHELIVGLLVSRKPVVAAVNGPAYGGALELALAARCIVAAPGATVGLPEITLQLLPGGGGTQLLSRFVGAEAAVEMLTSGRPVATEEALELGLFEAVVEQESLLAVAVDKAAQLVGMEPVPPWPEDAEASLSAIARRRVQLAESRSGVSSAASWILDAMSVGIRDGMEAGLARERQGFLVQLRSPEARAAIHLFRAEADIKRTSRALGTVVERIGVVGAGQMGSGIAANAVLSGLDVTVRDVDAEALDRARTYRDNALRRTAPSEGRDDRAERWQASTGWESLASSEVVIEAVFEDRGVKDTVLSELSRAVSRDTLLATNTSAIPIWRLATSVDHPERFLGMHFFSPVERMPLVELVPHEATSRETIDRAASLARQLGKVPVVVGDVPGFFTSRVYARWLIEGIRLVTEGVEPADVDDAARAVGFPVGPLQAHDEATIALVLQASITQVADAVMIGRLPIGEVRDALETLDAAGVRGRRHGSGFYVYDQEGHRIGTNDQILRHLGVTQSPIHPETVAERLLLAFASECFLCWDEGILCHPSDGDVASVLGIGFPRHLGGPFNWADEVGAGSVIERLGTLGATEFPAGSSLHQLDDLSERFSDQTRRATPTPTTAGNREQL